MPLIPQKFKWKNSFCPIFRCVAVICTSAIWILFAPHALSAGVEETIAKAQKQQLAYNSGWLALGHYYQKGIQKHWYSEADNAGFFLSPTGKFDPDAELIATLKAFYRDMAKSPSAKTDSFCRFPARRMWLEQRLNIHFSIKQDRCPALEEWTSKLHNKKISILFASSYMDSPSSMFGHTYLRFYDDSKRSALLSDTMNYAANAEDRKGIIDFAYRGLLGGFPGVVDKLPHYRRVRTYTENEGRSLWEYPTTLSKNDTNLISAHLWEIKNKNFDYFFLDENCSYRLLSIIAVAKPEKKLLSSFQRIAIPVDTIRELKQKDIIASAPIYWPSADAKLFYETQHIDSMGINLVIAIANTSLEINEEKLKTLSPEKQKIVLLAALEYISIEISREKISMEKSDHNAEKIKEHLLTIDANISQKNIPMPPQPDSGHLSSRAGIAFGNQGGDNYTGINYRTAYHDFLDGITGFDRGAEVNVLSLGARQYENGGSDLENFTLLDVTSRPVVTRFFQPSSWNFHINAHQRHIGEDKVTVGDIGYLHGKSFLLGDMNFSAMAGANIITANYYQNNIGIEPALKIDFYEQKTNFSYGASFNYSIDTSGHYPNQSVLGLQSSWPIFNAYRVAVIYEHELLIPSHEDSLSIGLYTYF